MHFNLIKEKYINSIDIAFRDNHDSTLDILDFHFTIILQFSTIKQRVDELPMSLIDSHIEEVKDEAGGEEPVEI
jgi:hypothetical protein